MEAKVKTIMLSKSANRTAYHIKCQTAGMITFRKGKIYSVDNQSGHFRPNIQSMGKVESALKELYERNPNLFSKDSKWR